MLLDSDCFWMKQKRRKSVSHVEYVVYAWEQTGLEGRSIGCQHLHQNLMLCFREIDLELTQR